jgi:hypothetical protein
VVIPILGRIEEGAKVRKIRREGEQVIDWGSEKEWKPEDKEWLRRGERQKNQWRLEGFKLRGQHGWLHDIRWRVARKKLYRWTNKYINKDMSKMEGQGNWEKWFYDLKLVSNNEFLWRKWHLGKEIAIFWASWAIIQRSGAIDHSFDKVNCLKLIFEKRKSRKT